jgi:hypothetical protein
MQATKAHKRCQQQQQQHQALAMEPFPVFLHSFIRLLPMRHQQQ